MPSKVFIPSLPTRHDEATGQTVPALDLNPAAEYGELVHVHMGPITRETITGAIDTAREQNVGPEDYILAVGDIVLLTTLITAACQANGTAQVLRWDKKHRAYDVVTVRL